MPFSTHRADSELKLKVESNPQVLSGMAPFVTGNNRSEFTLRALAYSVCIVESDSL